MDGKNIYIREKALALLISTLLLVSNSMLHGQLLLNEIMSSNTSVLEDRFGEYPDWIELYYTGEEAISLDGYFLSDDSAQLDKWQLPSIEITDDSYTLLFASGKDISEVPAFWHTVVNIGEDWHYYLPDSDIGDEWKSSLEAVQSWDVGKSSFGYDDNDDTTIVAKNLSLYIQKEFTLASTAEISDAVFYMDYDDGFVAYLNGTEIARSASMSEAGVDVAFDALASNHEAVMINGGQPEAYFLSDYLHLFQEGSNVLAVEVHNTNSTSSDLSCIPFLIMGFNSFQSTILSGNQFIVLRNQYPHANFKIDSDGEAIYLSDAQGSIIDSLPNVQLPSDYSYGRIPGLQDSCGYFQEATPGSLNSSDFSTDYFNDSVEIVVTGTPFSTYHQFELLSSDVSDTIYYTTDFSDPTTNSKVYTSPVLMSGTKIVKARIIRHNSLPGPLASRSILSGRKPEIPVISVSTDPENLWDYNSGIYVEGPNASSSNPHFGANYWQDWEKPVHLELYDAGGDLVFQQDGGGKIFGAWSRAHAQKSMSFFARNVYGNSRFAYPFFQKKEMDEYKSFVLRNSGNDFNNVMFRDPISAYLAQEMDLDHQAYQPLVKYLNGEYWGIINMREKINEHFIAGNHMIDQDGVNLLENDVTVKHGNADRYHEFMAYIRANNMSNDELFEGVNDYIDVENLIRYWTLNVYIDNKDWPGNNQRYWASNVPGSLFKWIVYDTEFGYSIYDASAYTFNTLEFSVGEGSKQNWANADWATEVMRTLLENEGFEHRLINSFADRMNYNFSAERMLPLVDSFQQRIAPEVSYHFEKWGGDVSSWESRVDRVKTFFSNRPGNMRSHVRSQFNLSGQSSIQVEIEGSNACRVRINSIIPDSYPFDGIYFNDVPIELEAIPGPGYRFVKWQLDNESQASVINWDMSRAASFKAVFEEVYEEADIVINEINYASSLALNTEDWIEIYNNGSSAVDVSSWYIEDESSGGQFFIPENTIMQAGSYLVFTKDHAMFRQHYPELKGVSGNLGFGFSSGGEGIALIDDSGIIKDVVLFNDVSPWPIDIEGSGSTLELINPSLENGIGENWQASYNYEGTPCEQNSVYAGVGVDPSKQDIFSEVKVFPVPFRNNTTITYTIEEEQEVDISIYSASGQLVSKVSQGRQYAGRHSVQWEPSGALPAGVYILSLRTEHDVQSKRLLYLGR